MLKIIRDLFVNDGPVGRTRRYSDSLLSAVSPGKILAAGTVWTGSLRPSIDLFVEKITPLTTPFTLGRVLHAEPTPATLEMGRVWAGDLASQICIAARSAGPTSDAQVDLTEVLAAVERLRAVLRVDRPNTAAISDGLRRVRDAATRVDGRASRTGDANPLKRLTMLSPEQRQSGPGSPENQRARDFWDSQANPPATRAIGDSGPGPSTAVRDALAAAARATDMRSRMEALNRASRAFWGARVT